MMDVKLIGGPHEGMILEIEEGLPEIRMDASPPEPIEPWDINNTYPPPNFKVARYRKKEFRHGNNDKYKSVVMYVGSNLNTDYDIIMELYRGYGYEEKYHDTQYELHRSEHISRKWEGLAADMENENIKLKQEIKRLIEEGRNNEPPNK